MAEWIILQQPGILLLTAVSVLLNLFDRKTGAAHGLLTILSAVGFLAGAALLFLAGAAIREPIALLTVFLLINIGEGK